MKPVWWCEVHHSRIDFYGDVCDWKWGWHSTGTCQKAPMQMVPDPNFELVGDSWIPKNRELFREIVYR